MSANLIVFHLVTFFPPMSTLNLKLRGQTLTWSNLSINCRFFNLLSKINEVAFSECNQILLINGGKDQSKRQRISVSYSVVLAAVGAVRSSFGLLTWMLCFPEVAIVTWKYFLLAKSIGLMVQRKWQPMEHAKLIVGRAVPFLSKRSKNRQLTIIDHHCQWQYNFI